MASIKVVGLVCSRGREERDRKIEGGLVTRYKYFYDQKELQIKMSSVTPFAFNAVELYIVTINENTWTRDREVCKALKYEKRARRFVRHHFTRENIQHKHQLTVVPTVGTTVN